MNISKNNSSALLCCSILILNLVLSCTREAKTSGDATSTTAAKTPEAVEAADNPLRNATPIFLGTEEFLNKSKTVPKMQPEGQWVEREDVLEMVSSYFPRISVLQTVPSVSLNKDTEKLLLYIDRKMLDELMNNVPAGDPCVGVAAMLAVELDPTTKKPKNQTFVLMPYNKNGELLTPNLINGIQYVGAERWPGHENLSSIMQTGPSNEENARAYFERVKKP